MDMIASDTKTMTIEQFMLFRFHIYNPQSMDMYKPYHLPQHDDQASGYSLLVVLQKPSDSAQSWMPGNSCCVAQVSHHQHDHKVLISFEEYQDIKRWLDSFFPEEELVYRKLTRDSNEETFLFNIVK